MPANYVPASMTTNYLFKGNLEKFSHKGEPLVWWYPKSIFAHKFLLVTAEPFRRYMDLRDQLAIPDDVRLLLDSGGFQWAMRGIEVPPEEVLPWQQENGNIGFSLDVPPLAVGQVGVGGYDGGVTDELFQRHIDITVRNNEAYRRVFNPEKKRCKLLQVLHGDKPERIAKWFNAMLPFYHDPFHSWAVSMKPPGDPLMQALGGMFLWQKYKDGVIDYPSPMHFLGVSGWNVIPVIVFIGHYVEDTIFDSSSYGNAMRYRKYHLPRQTDPEAFWGHVRRAFTEDQIAGFYHTLRFGSPGEGFLQHFGSPAHEVADLTDIWSVIFRALELQLGGGREFAKDTTKGLITKMPCTCPICTFEPEVSWYLSTGGVKPGLALCLHNMWNYVQYTEYLKLLLSTRGFDVFMEYCRPRVSHRGIRAIEFAKHCFETSFQDGYERFKDDFKAIRIEDYAEAFDAFVPEVEAGPQPSDARRGQGGRKRNFSSSSAPVTKPRTQKPTENDFSSLCFSSAIESPVENDPSCYSSREYDAEVCTGKFCGHFLGLCKERETGGSGAD